jgi:hypothetical protein
MEIWKDIKDYQGKYQVSNLGRVKSLNYNHTGKERILKSFINTKGYSQIVLCKNGKAKTLTIHRLVYQAFNGELIEGLVIDHISGNPLDDRSINLQQITSRQNTVKGKFCQGKTSKYVGVSFYKNTNNWVANIGINNKRISLGYFKTELEAHEAYQKALKNI